MTYIKQYRKKPVVIEAMLLTETNVHDANAGPWPNDFLASLNGGYFRAKYIGNRDDYLELANQSRLATSEEIERAKSYKQSGFKTTEKGQLVLL